MKEKNRVLAGVVLFCVFTVMFIIGCTTPEAGIVLKKATGICLECIGLGG